MHILVIFFIKFCDTTAEIRKCKVWYMNGWTNGRTDRREVWNSNLDISVLSGTSFLHRFVIWYSRIMPNLKFDSSNSSKLQLAPALQGDQKQDVVKLFYKLIVYNLYFFKILIAHSLCLWFFHLTCCFMR